MARVGWVSRMKVMRIYALSVGWLECVGLVVGVVNLLWSCLFFQNPAFGPFITNDRVQRDNPRKASGLCVKAVRSVANDIANAILVENW